MEMVEVEIKWKEGHTRAMQLPHVFDGAGRHLIYCADLIPTAAHVPVPWVMAYDNEPLVLMAEKRKLLPRVVDEDWVVFFEHATRRSGEAFGRLEFEGDEADVTVVQLSRGTVEGRVVQADGTTPVSRRSVFCDSR